MSNSYTISNSHKTFFVLSLYKGHKTSKKLKESTDDQSKRHVQSYNDPLAEQNQDEQDEASPMPQPGHMPQNLNGIIQKYKPKKIQNNKNKNKNKQGAKTYSLLEDTPDKVKTGSTTGSCKFLFE